MGLKEEQELKMKYLLETEDFEGMQIVKLTTDNVAKVEAMIMTDSDYAKSGDVNAGPDDEDCPEKGYSGSTAHWMTRLKRKIDTADQTDLKKIVKWAVNAVDRENSTHINADGVGRDQLKSRILKRAMELKTILSNLNTGADFIKYIAAITDVSEKNKEEQEKDEPKVYKARTNFSFATKFAHHACFYLFDEEDKRDAFSIYDEVLIRALPIYVKKYGLGEYEPNNYCDYHRCVGRVIDFSGGSLSRNGFDHLIWYYFKSRLDLIKTRWPKRPAPIEKTGEGSPQKIRIDADEIYKVVAGMKENAHRNGLGEIEIKASEVGEKLGISGRMAAICNAMRRAKKPGDEEMDVPKNGYGSKMKIKYKL